MAMWGGSKPRSRTRSSSRVGGDDGDASSVGSKPLGDGYIHPYEVYREQLDGHEWDDDAILTMKVPRLETRPPLTRSRCERDSRLTPVATLAWQDLGELNRLFKHRKDYEDVLAILAVMSIGLTLYLDYIMCVPRPGRAPAPLAVCGVWRAVATRATAVDSRLVDADGLFAQQYQRETRSFCAQVLLRGRAS